ncbi:hypothetical protein BH20PSE1_BH20PSE1_04600 [soil metagenome]
MLSCKDSSRLLSDALDRELDVREQTSLDQHLEICPACQNCKDHFARLIGMFSRLVDGG